MDQHHIATNLKSFEALKPFFESETGLEWKSHLDTYIQYVQAKLLDEISFKLTEIRNKIPEDISLL